MAKKPFVAVFASVALLCMLQASVLGLGSAAAAAAAFTPGEFTVDGFTACSVTAAPSGATLFLTDNAGSKVYRADLEVGTLDSLALPSPPKKALYAGSVLLVWLQTPAAGEDDIAVIDLASLTVTSTIHVGMDVKGFTADGAYVYAYNTDHIEVYSLATGEKTSSLGVGNLSDLSVNPINGKLYGCIYGSTLSLRAEAGQLTQAKQLSGYSGVSAVVMPDGAHLLLSTGALLTCSTDDGQDLQYVSSLITAYPAAADAERNELYVANERLLEVYDASTLAFKRIIAEPRSPAYLFCTPGTIIIGQTNSAGKLAFRRVDAGALLKTLKVNGEPYSEFYPTHFNTDRGDVPYSTDSVMIEATPYEGTAVVSGDTGTVPLAVGDNTLEISVRNPITGRTQTYALHILRGQTDPPANTNNGLQDLGFTPMDSVFDAERNAVYMTAAGGSSLYRVDIVTGAITEKKFVLKAERLTLANGSIYVTLLRTSHETNEAAERNGYGAVAVVDAATFRTLRVFNVNIDPWDIESDEDGVVYLAPSSRQTSILASYDGGNGRLISRINKSVVDNRIARNPVTGRLYSILSNNLSSSFYAYGVTDGIITEISYSPYLISSRLTGCMEISPDGRYIFNGSGDVFACAPTKAGDMKYAGTLGVSFTSACFDLPGNTMYCTNGKALYAFACDSRKLRYTMPSMDEFIGVFMNGGSVLTLKKTAGGAYYLNPVDTPRSGMDLSGIALSCGTLQPAFSGDVTDYSLVLDETTASVAITPSLSDSAASMTINGEASSSKTLSLERGSTATVSITVTTVNGAQKAYMLRVYRQAGDSFFLNAKYFTPQCRLAVEDALYLTGKDQPFIYRITGGTGAVRALRLPGVAQQLGRAGDALLVALCDAAFSRYSIGVVNPDSLTLLDMFDIPGQCISLTGDADRIYVCLSDKLMVFDRDSHQILWENNYSYTDLLLNPANGLLYATDFSVINSFRFNGSALERVGGASLSRQHAGWVMAPDGKNIVLAGGVVYSCGDAAATDLKLRTTLANAEGIGILSAANELVVKTGRLLTVYDAGTFDFKRVLPETAAVDALECGSSCIFVTQKNADGASAVHTAYAGALPAWIKVDGETGCGLYPLRMAADLGEVPYATASVDLTAAAVPGAAISGGTGIHTLAVGVNTFTLTVTNTEPGRANTYTLTLTRRSSDPPLQGMDAFTNLGFTPLDSVLDEAHNAVYMTEQGGGRLLRVDLSTGQITSKSFGMAAGRLALAGGSIYLTLLRTGSEAHKGLGAVAVVDAATFKTLNIFQTNIDPCDIEADESGRVYLSPTSYDYCSFSVYEGATGRLLSAKVTTFPNYLLQRNASSGKLYYLELNVSPQDIGAFEVADGIVTATYGSQYHGDYKLSDYMELSPDGKFVFTGAGNIFTCAPEQTGDMAYNGSLGAAYTSVCFDLPHDTFYCVNGRTLSAYAYGSRTLQFTVPSADEYAGIYRKSGGLLALKKNADGEYYFAHVDLSGANAMLSGITLSAGTLTPAFDSGVTDYSLVLPEAVGSVDITPRLSGTDASLTIDGAAVTSKTVTLEKGMAAAVAVRVTSADGTAQKCYTLRVYRQTGGRSCRLDDRYFKPKYQVAAAAGDLYLAGDNQQFIYRVSGATGSISALFMPGVVQGIGTAGSDVLVTLYDAANDRGSVAIVSQATFTVTGTFDTGEHYTGITGDADYIYLYCDDMLSAFGRSSHTCLSSVSLSSVSDAQVNPANGNVYIHGYYEIRSYKMSGGKLTFVARSDRDGAGFVFMPDGKHVATSKGMVFSCGADSKTDLKYVTTLPNAVSSAVVTASNELITMDDRLLSVYDATTLEFKRVMPEPYEFLHLDTPTTGYLKSTGDNLFIVQNGYKCACIRAVNACAVLAGLKVNGEPFGVFYPLRFSYDLGVAPFAMETVDIAASTAQAGAAVSGDTGTRPLQVGMNTFKVTVTDAASGQSNTYSFTLTRSAGDTSVTPANAFEDLGFTPLDACADPDRHVAYMTASGGKSLYRVDLDTGTVAEKQFEFKAERLAIANGRIYVSLTEFRTSNSSTTGYGAVAVVDTATFKTLAIFPTNLDPFDIEADEAGHVYLTSGSSQHGALSLYDSATGRLLSKPYTVCERSFLARSAAAGRLYVTEVNVYPNGMQSFRIEDGVISDRRDWQNNDFDLSLYSSAQVSPDGSRIYNGSGVITACAAAQPDDMKLLSTQSETFHSICFDPQHDRFFTAFNNGLTTHTYSTNQVIDLKTFTYNITHLLYSYDTLVVVCDKNKQYFVKLLGMTPVSGVSLNKTEMKLYTGQSAGLTATVTPADAVVKGLSWTSDNSNVATVNEGTVTAVAPGTARIRATTIDGGYSAECAVTVSMVTVRFDSKGNGTIPDKTVNYGAAVPRPDPPAKTGYRVTKWCMDYGCAKEWNFDSDRATGDMTLYAGWTPNTYTVVYNANGGAGCMPSGSHTYDVEQPLTANGFTRTGYSFTGWATSRDGETAYTNGVSVRNLTSDPGAIVTLYAVWSLDSYTVAFDSQGGSEVNDKHVAYNAEYGPLVVPVRQGYTFGGWFTQKDGVGDHITSDTKLSLASNHTLYAKWTINTYTVSFNSQGGNTVRGVTAQHNTSIIEPAAPVRTGYRFTGWYKDSACKTSWNFNADKVLADITLYAGWAWAAGAPGKPAVASASCSALKVTWPAVPGASGYEVWRSPSGNGTFKKLNDVASADYTDTGLATGTAYYYKIKSFIKTGAAKTAVSGFSAVAHNRPVPAAPGSLQASPASYNTLKLTWSTVAGATRYELWRATSPNGTYKRLITTSSRSYMNKNLATGAAYYYKVRAYRLVSEKKVYGGWSAIINAQTVLGAPARLKAARASSTSVRLTWGAVAGRTRYEIWRCDVANGAYSLVGTATGTSFTNTRLKPGQAYRYKMRAYHLEGRRKVYGGWTPVISVKP